MVLRFRRHVVAIEIADIVTWKFMLSLEGVLAVSGIIL